MKIGIIAGSFKPFTSGHLNLIDKAIKNNKKVELFVSTTDRIRKNEQPVYWKQMEIIWKQFITPFLSNKVNVVYDPNPTVAMFNLLKSADENLTDNNIYTFYADSEDIKYIENPRIALSLPRLTKNNQLRNISISREKNINVSGTLARQAILEGDMKKFIGMLPEYQRITFGELIFNILAGK